MGIERNSATALMEARRDGVSFERVITLGRQFLTVAPSWIFRELRSVALEPAVSWAELRPASDPSWAFAEPFFYLLGAKHVDAIDASDYEGATIVHDLNHPLPARLLEQRYNLVYDSGALEHIFHFPVAIANLMKLAEVGGHLIIHTPINNWCGHGFYQFSPELFYKVFSPSNGFVVERMLVVEMFYDGYRYEVMEPAKAGSRLELMNGCRVHVFVQAKKVQDVEPFASFPQQGDYEVAWRNSPRERQAYVPVPESGRVLPLVRGLLRKASPGVLRWLRLQRDRAETKRFSPAHQPEKFKRVPS